MSATVTPATTTAISASQTATDLLNAAEQNPVVKADLQSLFDSYSHSAAITGGALIAGALLAQRGITVDNTLLTVVIGLVSSGVIYGAQWVAMKFSKPATQGVAK